MAVVEQPLPQAAKQSFRGLFYIQVRRGVAVAVIWPDKRKRKITKTQRERQEYLAALVIQQKWQPPEMSALFADAWKGNRILERDANSAFYTGKLMFPTAPEGNNMAPASYRNLVLRFMDAIRPPTCGLPYRGAQYWHLLRPSAAGQRLTSMGPGYPPKWL